MHISLIDCHALTWSPCQALDRRVPKNPKYAEVKSVVDTGASVSKVKMINILHALPKRARPAGLCPPPCTARLPRWLLSPSAPTREYLKRKDEIFKRVRPSTLAAILDESKEAPESVFEHSGAPRVVVHAQEAQAEYSKVRAERLGPHSLLGWPLAAPHREFRRNPPFAAISVARSAPGGRLRALPHRGRCGNAQLHQRRALTPRYPLPSRATTQLFLSQRPSCARIASPQRFLSLCVLQHPVRMMDAHTLAVRLRLRLRRRTAWAPWS